MRSRIYTIISGHFKSWYRSKSNIFWTIAFPLLLIVLFGAIFGNGSTKFDLYLQNQDLTGNVPTPLSQGYVNVLNQTGAFNLHIVAAEQPDPLTYVKKDAQDHNQGQRLLVIPLGFNATIMSGKNATVQLYMDQSDQASASLAGIVHSVTVSYAAAIANVPDHLVVQQVGIVTRNIRYIDFFIPGVIGMTLLTTGVFGAVNTNGRYRELKIIKKLATTPLSKIEWILGMVGYQMILATISLTVILFFGYAIFGVTATIDIYTVGLVVAAALLFPGIGMVLANFVKEAESADAAANAITFPMMFLAGTFWPRETLPDIMKIIANFMPLTYVNDGLRDALIYAEPAQALTNTLIALGLAAFFIVIGAVLFVGFLFSPRPSVGFFPFGSLALFLPFLVILGAFWVFTIISAVFLKRSYEKISQRLNVSAFATAGLLYLIGAALTIVLVGFLILLIALVFQVVAYFSIQDRPPTPGWSQPSQQTFAPPVAAQPATPSQQQSPVESKFCFKCGAKLPIVAVF